MHDIIDTYRRSLRLRFTAFHRIKLLATNFPDQIRVIQQPFGSYLVTTFIEIGNRSFGGFERTAAKAGERAADLAVNFLHKIMKEITESSEYHPHRQMMDTFDPANWNDGHSDSAPPIDPFSQVLRSDSELSQIFDHLTKHSISFAHDCRLFVDSVTLKPMYQAIITVSDVGEFIGKSNLSKLEAISEVSKKFKSLLPLIAPDLMPAKFDLRQFEARRESSTTINSIAHLSDSDLRKIDFINLFNSVFDPNRSPLEVMRSLEQQRKAARFEFIINAKNYEKIKIFNITLSIAQLSFTFNAIGRDVAATKNRLLLKAYERFVQFSQMIYSFNLDYSPKIEPLKFVKTLIAAHPDALRIRESAKSENGKFRADFSIEYFATIFVDYPNRNHCHSATTTVAIQAIEYLKLLSKQIQLSKLLSAKQLNSAETKPDDEIRSDSPRNTATKSFDSMFSMTDDEKDSFNSNNNTNNNNNCNFAPIRCDQFSQTESNPKSGKLIDLESAIDFPQKLTQSNQNNVLELKSLDADNQLAITSIEKKSTTPILNLIDSDINFCDPNPSPSSQHLQHDLAFKNFANSAPRISLIDFDRPAIEAPAELRPISSSLPSSPLTPSFSPLIDILLNQASVPLKRMITAPQPLGAEDNFVSNICALINCFNQVDGGEKSEHEVIAALQSALNACGRIARFDIRTERISAREYVSELKCESIRHGFFAESTESGEHSTRAVMRKMIHFFRNLAKLIADYKSDCDRHISNWEMIDRLRRSNPGILRINTSSVFKCVANNITIIQFLHLASFENTATTEIGSKNEAALAAIHFLRQLSLNSSSC